MKDLIKKIDDIREMLDEKQTQNMFWIITGIFAAGVLLYLAGIVFKIAMMFLPLLFVAVVGFCGFFIFCPKFDETQQKIGMTALLLYPIILTSSLINIPIFSIANAMSRRGFGSGISMLSPLMVVICIIVFITLYRSDSAKEKIERIKEMIKTGSLPDQKPGRNGDVVLCIEKETGRPEIWPYKDRFLHMLILGPTGSGKTSQTILPLLNQDMQNREAGITVLEPKGDLAQKAAMMAQYYSREFIYFDPSFKNCPHFNPLFGKESDVVENMATTFRMLNPDSPQFFLDLNEQLMRNAVKVLKRLDKAEGVDGRWATFIRLSQLLQNSAGQGRKMVVAFSTIRTDTQEEAKENADIASWFLNDYFAERSKVYENTSGVRSQVAKLVSNEHLRNVLNPDFDKGERNQLDFDKHLAEGGVLCICTAQGTLRDLGKYLGYFIILQLQSAVFRRPGNENTRRAHFLYIDEFQTYSNPGFSDMLTQGRSYRVACHLATQARAQMAMGGGRDGRNFVQLVSTNARNIVLYPGCSNDDAEYYSKQFGEYEKVEIQKGESHKKFNLLTGGMDKLGHPTETIRESKKMTAIFSPSDLIYRPFGEIVYCLIKNNSIQTPKVGLISYIPADMNQKLDEMIEVFDAENKKDPAGGTGNQVVFPDSGNGSAPDTGYDDPAADELNVEENLKGVSSVPVPDDGLDDIAAMSSSPQQEEEPDDPTPASQNEEPEDPFASDMSYDTEAIEDDDLM